MQIYRYEKGKGEPSADYLARIARQLEVSTDYLLGLSDDEVGLLRETPLTVEQRRLLTAFANQDARYFTLLVAQWLQEKLDSDIDLTDGE
jgi:transcriptional regulator with XRE-family HTH domain